MVVDIGEVKRHIKPKADSTLRNMRKDDLIEYIRCLEHNYNVAVSFNENQAKYIESLDAAPVVHGRWIPCENGGYYCSHCDRRVAFLIHNKYCSNCGAKMDGGADHGKTE